MPAADPRMTPDRSFAARLTGFLIAARWPLLALAAVLAVLSIRPARLLTLERSVESMFAPGDPLLPAYEQLKRTFGGNEMAMATYVDPEILTPAGMQRLAELDARLESIPGVQATLSLYSPLGDGILNDDDSFALLFRELFEGYTHGADGKTVAVLCMLIPQDKTDVPREETILKLREAIQTQTGGELAGEPVMVVEGFRYIEEDAKRLGWMCTLLLILTIVLFFRSLRWVVIPILVVQFTLLLTRAVLSASGFRMTMVSSMLTAIVTVVGIAAVIHVIVRFRDARAEGLAPREALLQAGTILTVPIFFACATDAVGFLALTYARVEPLRDFGIMMSVGALLVLVSMALLVPGLALAGRFDPDPKRAWGEARLDAGLRRLLRWTEGRQKTIGLATVAIVAASVVGITWTEIETDFTKNFRHGSPIVQSYAFVEENLGGAGVWDIVLPAPEILNWRYIYRVRRLEGRLRKDVPQLTNVLSIADTLKQIPSGLRNQFILSGSLRLLRKRLPDFYDALYYEDPDSPGKYFFRIMLRADERQSAAAKVALIEDVTRISREEFPETEHLPAAQITGYFVLLTNLIKSVLQDQWMTFAIACGGIALMMMLAFRSPLLALVALVPNALPILVVTGLMGWLGLKINMGAAMIAAVSVGLSVDSSIHYITGFRRARRAGLSTHAALETAQQQVGHALVFSTLALIVGFSALMNSDFVPTIYFGALVSLSMLGGLAGNLIVLPLLLQLVSHDKNPAVQPP